jgi:carboxypeptidase family protein/TonB-dependent receptor-like protein
MRNTLLLFAAVLMAVTLNAQSGVRLSGTTEDQTGAVIPGEKLTLINQKTKESRATTSDGEGAFSFESVPPGSYVLRGEAEGFETREMRLTVHNRPVPGLKVGMALGASEEITVTASSQSAAPENNANAVYLSNEMLGALPSQSQDILPILNNYLSPAATGTGGASIVVDGVETGDLSLPTEALKRVYVNKNPYSAEYRKPGSGRVEVITRNGSRGHFDGSVAFYARNDIFDARNAFVQAKPELNRRLVEGTFGGPLPFLRGRFFLSGSRLMDNGSAVVNAVSAAGPLRQNVPTSEDKTNLSGRLDLRPNTANTVTLFYSFFDQPERNREVGGLRLADHGTTAVDRSHKFQFSETAVLSPRFLNVARFTFESGFERLGIPPAGPATIVRGAFTDGPSQSARAVRDTRYGFQDIASYTRGAHTLRFGGAFRPKYYDFTDATNFGGTFTFADLTGFQSGQPILFQIARGTSQGSFYLPDADVFAQDEIKVNPSLTVMLGLRYDWQAKVKDHNNLGPRIAVAFAPGARKTVLRAGAGVFYERVPDEAFQQSLFLDGVNAAEFVINSPQFPNPSIVGVAPSTWRLAQDLQTPYLFQSSVAVERQVSTLKATLEYRHLRGVHLLRARDVNALIAGASTRPDPNFTLIRQIESTASLNSNAFVASLQGRVASALKLKAQYTLSHTDNNTDGPFFLPADSRDLAPEWGRASFDRRHRFTMASTIDFPASFRLGSMFTATSGGPFNITTGDNALNDGIANDRPLGVTRNSGNAPGFVQLDLRLTKGFSLFGTKKSSKDSAGYQNLEFSIDVFNVFNHANLTDVIGNLSSPRFGLATAALQPRTIQLSVKYNFRAVRE